MKKVVFYVAYWTVGSFLLIWPFALLATVMLFDAPLRGALDGFSRFSAVLAVGVFPLLYRKAWKRGNAALVGCDSFFSILAPLVFPLFCPAWLLLFFDVIGPVVYGK